MDMEVMGPRILLGIFFIGSLAFIAARYWARAILSFSLISILAGVLFLILFLLIEPEWIAQAERMRQSGRGPVQEIEWMHYTFDPLLVVYIGTALPLLGITVCLGFGLSKVFGKRRI